MSLQAQLSSVICFIHPKQRTWYVTPNVAVPAAAFPAFPAYNLMRSFHLSVALGLSQGQPCTTCPVPWHQTFQCHRHSLFSHAPTRAGQTFSSTSQPHGEQLPHCASCCKGHLLGGQEKPLALLWEKPWPDLAKAAEMLRPRLCRSLVFPFGFSGSAPHQRCTRQGWSEATRPGHQVFTHWHVTSKALGCSSELLLPPPPGLHAAASNSEPAAESSQLLSL